MSFALDPRLAADTREIGDLKLSRALLMNDARYPWIILVPRRAGLSEITDLDAAERAQWMEELAKTAQILRALPEVEKINLGALGNTVRQLHGHVVGRRAGDFAWPGPVWGSGPALAYDPIQLEVRLDWMRNRFGLTP